MRITPIKFLISFKATASKDTTQGNNDTQSEVKNIKETPNDTFVKEDKLDEAQRRLKEEKEQKRKDFQVLVNKPQKYSKEN